MDIKYEIIEVKHPAMPFSQMFGTTFVPVPGKLVEKNWKVC